MAINKILIVDDSPTELMNMRSILAEAGYTALTASNGKEALACAKADKPDLIFLDIVMPDLDGFGTCRALAKDSATKHIPVVFVTSKNQKADRVWAQMQGAKGYITKPYSADNVLHHIQAFL